MGTAYFQNKERLPLMDWNIVEQKNLIDYMTKEIPYRFGLFTDTQDCIYQKDPDVALFSGSLQYIEHPYKILGLVAKTVDYIIFDHTTFIDAEKDRLTRQIINPKIYPARFPCWFFSENKIKNFLSQYGFRFESESDTKSIKLKGVQAAYKDMFFIKTRVK